MAREGERKGDGGTGKQKQMFIISNSVSINSIVLETGPKYAPTGREGDGAYPPIFGRGPHGASINFYDAPANVAAAKI